MFEQKEILNCLHRFAQRRLTFEMQASEDAENSIGELQDEGLGLLELEP